MGRHRLVTTLCNVSGCRSLIANAGNKILHPMTPAPAKRGRKPDASSKSGQIRALLASGMSTAEIAKKVGCTPALVYNVKAKAGGAKKRGPGRPAKAKGAKGTRKAAASISTATGIEGILVAVKGAEQERAKMLAALEKIQVVLADALR